MPLNKDIKVIVRVWTSKKNKQYPGHDDLGHVSVEAGNKYMSFWPQIPPTDAFTEEEKQKYRDAGRATRKILSINKYLKTVKNDTEMTFEDDYRAEEGPPQITICFYALDSKKLLKNLTNEVKVRTLGYMAQI